MYIRKATRTYKGKVYTNYLLVESVSTPQGPRQRVICALGALSPRPREEWLKLAHKMQAALSGQGELFESEPAVAELRERARRHQHRLPRGPGAQPQWVGVEVEKLEMEEVREAGPVQVGYTFWRRLGLENILAQAGLDKKTRVLTCAMVLNRLVHPCSEHAMPAWIRRSALTALLKVDLDRLTDTALYRNLDRLPPKRAWIESALTQRERTLFNLDPTIYL